MIGWRLRRMNWNGNFSGKGRASVRNFERCTWTQTYEAGLGEDDYVAAFDERFGSS